ncbi:MAG TPA: gamma-glutamylcyclotransferase family protein [Segetibacter sp.]
MEDKVLKLFVYGSLRSGFHHPAYGYISKYFTLISPATVKGKLYDLGDYPAAIPTNDEAFIVGELYELKSSEDFAWAIEQLDAYEGVNPDEGEPRLYKRELAEVYYNGQTTHAWIYWYSHEIEDQPLIPSGDIFDFIANKSKI